MGRESLKILNVCLITNEINVKEGTVVCTTVIMKLWEGRPLPEEITRGNPLKGTELLENHLHNVLQSLTFILGRDCHVYIWKKQWFHEQRERAKGKLRRNQSSFGRQSDQNLTL